MSAFSNLGNDVSGGLKNRADLGIVLGILTAVLGLLLIAYPLFAATVTTIVIGCILVLAGVLEVVQALRVYTIGAFFRRLLLGVVYGFAGVVVLMYPLRGVATLTVALSVLLLFEALATAALAFQVKPVLGWFLFDAAITAILGFLILVHWPASSIWAIGTLVGAAILIRGITRISLSTRLRSVAKKVEEMHTRPQHKEGMPRDFVQTSQAGDRSSDTGCPASPRTDPDGRSLAHPVLLLDK
jgi:uncharacterized membrane protein HdeD (DUF308 family)